MAARLPVSMSKARLDVTKADSTENSTRAKRIGVLAIKAHKS